MCTRTCSRPHMRTRMPVMHREAYARATCRGRGKRMQHACRSKALQVQMQQNTERWVFLLCARNASHLPSLLTKGTVHTHKCRIPLLLTKDDVALSITMFRLRFPLTKDHVAPPIPSNRGHGTYAQILHFIPTDKGSCCTFHKHVAPPIPTDKGTCCTSHPYRQRTPVHGHPNLGHAR